MRTVQARVHYKMHGLNNNVETYSDRVKFYMQQFSRNQLNRMGNSCNTSTNSCWNTD